MVVAEEERQKLRCLITESTAPIFGVTATGIIEEWNQVAEDMFGYSPSDVIGKEFVRTLVHPDAGSYMHKVLNEVKTNQRDEESICTVKRRPCLSHK